MHVMRANSIMDEIYHQMVCAKSYKINKQKRNERYSHIHTHTHICSKNNNNKKEKSLWNGCETI